MSAASTKRCIRCGVTKDIGCFGLKDVTRGWRQSACRPCVAAYGRTHYERNRSYYIDKARRRRATDRDANQKLVLGYLREHPCVDCAASDPVVLEFDHRDPATKTAAIARLINSNTRPTLERELAKCDVRCANCHRRRTARQFGWFRQRVAKRWA